MHVSLSHEVVGTFREYERAATTEVDAALSPLLGTYLRRLGERTAAAGLPDAQIMQSSGGLVDADTAARHAVLTVLSGPGRRSGRGGAVARACGEPDLLCFDMGGTSCDVCVVEDGRVRESAGREIAGPPDRAADGRHPHRRRRRRLDRVARRGRRAAGRPALGRRGPRARGVRRSAAPSRR